MTAVEFRSIGIGVYRDPSFTPLEADCEAAKVRALLERFGVGGDVKWHEEGAIRGYEAVDARLNDWARSDADAAVLYWVGHGVINATDTRLATGSTDRQYLSGAVGATALAERLVIRDADELKTDRWTAVFIDACRSAGFVREVGAELDRRGGPRRVLLFGSSEPGNATRLGRFTTALELALMSFRNVERVELTRLAREIRRQLQPEGEVVAKNVDHAILRNDWAIPAGMLTPADCAPEVEAVMSTLTQTEQQALIDAASGGALGTNTWYYTGREGELSQVGEWFQRDENLLIVTGEPGSGKSAFLGNLLLRSNRSVWDLLGVRIGDDPNIHGHDLPTVRPFLGALRLTGLTLSEVVPQIAQRLGKMVPKGLVSNEERISWLSDSLDEVSAGDEAPTMLLDSLDESAEPLEIAQAVICRLTATGRLRFVIGTRRSTRSRLGVTETDHDIMVALQDPELRTSTLTLERDPEALLDYVSRRIETVHAGRPLAFLSDVGPICQKIASASTDFLYARLATLEVSETSGIIDLEQVEAIVSGDHATIFGRAFARLTAERRTFGDLLRSLAMRRGRGLPVEQGLWTTAASVFTPAGNKPPTDSDIQALIFRAGPYLLLDHEKDHTVYRLAHESFEDHIRGKTP